MAKENKESMISEVERQVEKWGDNLGKTVFLYMGAVIICCGLMSLGLNQIGVALFVFSFIAIKFRKLWSK